MKAKLFALLTCLFALVTGALADGLIIIHNPPPPPPPPPNASGQLKPLVDRAMMERMNPFRFKSQGEAPVTLGSVTAMALEGFTRNSFFLLIDGQQITDLDQVITLKPTSDVTFVRLMPLKGG
jgi:hypothetical protein